MLKNCPDSNNWVIQAPVLHNKRASYSPAGAVTGTHSHNHGGVGGGHHHGPQSSDFLFGAPRFQERYRSNSMDSILVEQERHARQPVFVQVSSHQKFWESFLSLYIFRCRQDRKVCEHRLACCSLDQGPLSRDRPLTS